MCKGGDKVSTEYNSSLDWYGFEIIELHGILLVVGKSLERECSILQRQHRGESTFARFVEQAWVSDSSWSSLDNVVRSLGIGREVGER